MAAALILLWTLQLAALSSPFLVTSVWIFTRSVGNPVCTVMSDSEEDSQDKQLKIVVVGDGACGKVRRSQTNLFNSPQIRDEWKISTGYFNVQQRFFAFKTSLKHPAPPADAAVFLVTMATDANVARVAKTAQLTTLHGKQRKMKSKSFVWFRASSICLRFI